MIRLTALRGLAAGTCTLIGTKAPEGYAKSDTSLTITIPKDTSKKAGAEDCTCAGEKQRRKAAASRLSASSALRSVPELSLAWS